MNEYEIERTIDRVIEFLRSERVIPVSKVTTIMSFFDAYKQNVIETNLKPTGIFKDFHDLEELDQRLIIIKFLQEKD